MFDITWRRFEEDDTYKIHLREHEQRLLDREFLNGIPKRKNSGIWTFFYDEHIVCIIGYFEMWPGVAETFVVPSIHTKKCPVLYCYRIRKHIRNLLKVTNFHRVQTESWANETTDRWMKFLGFKEEGVLKRYTSTKEDYKMWAMYPEVK